jgi:hypothetical protein
VRSQLVECGAGSRLEVRRFGFVTAELRNVSVQTYSTETCGDTRSEGCLYATFRTDGIPENLTNFFLGAHDIAPPTGPRSGRSRGARGR